MNVMRHFYPVMQGILVWALVWCISTHIWVHVYFRETRLSQILLQGLFSFSDAKQKKGRRTKRDSGEPLGDLLLVHLPLFPPSVCEQTDGTWNLKRAASSTQSEILRPSEIILIFPEDGTVDVFWGTLKMQLFYFCFFLTSCLLYLRILLTSGGVGGRPASAYTSAAWSASSGILRPSCGN